jgi:hypothetical protein
MSNAAQIVADYIRDFDPKLAQMFIAQPFRRVQIAQAFAKGIVVPKGQHDYQMGQTLIELAEMDRDERIAYNTACDAVIDHVIGENPAIDNLDINYALLTAVDAKFGVR